MLRALPFLAFAISTVLLVLAGASPRPGDRVLAAVYPPWWSDARIGEAAASAGAIASGGGVRNVLLIQAERPGLSKRTLRSGAMLVLDARAARFCVDASSEAFRVL